MVTLTTLCKSWTGNMQACTDQVIHSSYLEYYDGFYGGAIDPKTDAVCIAYIVIHGQYGRSNVPLGWYLGNNSVVLAAFAFYLIVHYSCYKDTMHRNDCWMTFLGSYAHKHTQINTRKRLRPGGDTTFVIRGIHKKLTLPPTHSTLLLYP